jgi:hypothetical protein
VNVGREEASMPEDKKRRGFSHEEIVEEFNDASEVDIENEKNTLPSEDGPSDSGRQLPDDDPDHPGYQPEGDDRV